MTVADEITAELDAVRRERDRLYRALLAMFRSEADLEEYLACQDGNCRCPGRWREAKA